MPAQAVSESIKIRSNAKHLKKVSTRIVDLLMKRNVDKNHIFDIRLSIEEAVLNAIEHGNKGDESQTVNISFVIDDQRIEITVEDQGNGFSHIGLPDPTVDGNILRSHGRGVYLIHKLMDKIQYNDKGNRVKLIKYFK